MTFAIAAAGTGGHVYPGLAVAEALVGRGVSASDIVFFGGTRMESTVVPGAGFDFVTLELQGLSRSFTLRNLMIPAVVRRATRAAAQELRTRSVRAVLGMGGYVTVPVGMAARSERIPVVLHEQNAHAGLANRFVARWAARVFVSFPNTRGLAGEIVGNPLRRAFRHYDASSLREQAAERYQLDPDEPTLGVFGGSLGAGALNTAVSELAARWSGGPLQIVHLVGRIHEEGASTIADAPAVRRRVVGFEERMDLFYAMADLVVARAGGSLYEIAATGTPAIVVPGSFGGGRESSGAVARTVSCARRIAARSASVRASSSATVETPRACSSRASRAAGSWHCSATRCSIPSSRSATVGLSAEASRI